MQTDNIRSKLTGLFFLFIVLLLVSCSARIPVGRYQLLQQSTSSLAVTTEDTYTRIEKLQRLFAITTAPDTTIDCDTFKSQIEGESFDLTPELRFREFALQVLFSYINVLHTLASTDYLEEVNITTQKLGGSLKNFLECATTLTPADVSASSGIFATLMNKLTRELINQNRKQALKQAMDLAQDDIDKLSKLISRSNLKIKTAVGIMLSRIIAHANATRPDYFSIDRVPFDMDIANLIAEVEEIELSLDTMSQAWSKIANAHRETRAALDKKQTSYESLQELIKEAERMNKFYRNLY